MRFREKFISLKKLIAKYSSREIKILVNLFILVTALLAFIYLAREVIIGDTQEFDEWVLNSLRYDRDIKLPIGPMWLTSLMTDITILGGATIIFITTAAVVFYLCIEKRYELMWLIMIATIGGALLSIGLKELFARERPPLIFHLLTVKSMSFPSDMQ